MERGEHEQTEGERQVREQTEEIYKVFKIVNGEEMRDDTTDVYCINCMVERGTFLTRSEHSFFSFVLVK